MIACLDQNEFKIEKIQNICEKKEKIFLYLDPQHRAVNPPPPNLQILRIDRKGMTDKMKSYPTTNDIICAKNAR